MRAILIGRCAAFWASEARTKPLFFHFEEIDSLMQKSEITAEQRQELTLLLLYLNSWTEEFGTLRAWKGHDFDLINALVEQDFITGNRGAKSIYFTPEGEAKALELMEKFFKQ